MEKTKFYAKILLLAFFILASSFLMLCSAQNVGINTTGATPSSNAILDLTTGNSRNMGILIPRVTLSSSLTTFNPPMHSAATTKDSGMLVYNSQATNQPIGYYYWNGSTWIIISGLPSWALSGSSGTTASTSSIGSTANNNFIGTTDATDFVLAANGYERIRIANGTGNVGISTTSPICALDIHGTGYLHVSGTNNPTLTSQGAYLSWNLTGGQGETDFFNTEGGGTGGFNFYNTTGSGPGTILLNITGTGSVGIGSNTPSRLLEVEGNSNTERIDGLKNGSTFNSSGTGSSSNIVYTNNTTGDIYSLPTVTNATLVTNSSGVPSWQTTGQANGLDWTLDGNTGITASTSSIGSTANNNFIGTSNAADFVMVADGYEAMRIANSTGYIGIGTTTPICKLDVMGAAAYLHVAGSNVPIITGQGAYLSWNNTGGQGETDFINNEGGGPGGFTFYNAPNSGSSKTILVNITGSGSVGIGSNSPNRLLEIEGSGNTIRIDGLANGSSFNISSTNSASNLMYTDNANGDVYAIPTINSGVLVTNSSGVPSWQTGTTNGINWSLIGNTGTTAPTSAINSTVNNNFIGTTDAKDFVLACDGLEGIRIATNKQYIGIGTTNPICQLDIIGVATDSNHGTMHIGGANKYPPKTSTKGGYISWNAKGRSEMDFVNNSGTGTGGFGFFTTPSNWASRQVPLYITEAGKIGINDTTPGGFGQALLEIKGKDSNFAYGPSIQCITNVDPYPLSQYFNYEHGSEGVSFDCYWDSNTFKSSWAGPVYDISNYGGTLNLNYGYGGAPGVVATMSPGIILNSSGQLGILVPSTSLGSDALVIGETMVPKLDGGCNLGRLGRRWSTVYATNGTIQTSDRRYKENIKDLSYGLKEVLQLRPVSYTWIKNPEEGTKLGLIAQEVQTVVKEVVEVGNDSAKSLGMNYAELIPVLINAIKQQQQLITKQQTTADTQQASIDELKNEVEALKQQMTAISKNSSQTVTAQK